MKLRRARFLHAKALYIKFNNQYSIYFQHESATQYKYQYDLILMLNIDKKPVARASPQGRRRREMCRPEILGQQLVCRLIYKEKETIYT